MLSETRLNTLVDAAFAFALTLMVTGGGQASRDLSGLGRALTEAPSFLLAFVIITMFWHAHVRWRRLQASGGVLASLLLVFLVLIFVHPLRVMAISLVDLLGFGDELSLTVQTARELFVFYGLSFFSMAAATSLLFFTAWRGAREDATARARAGGELGIWLILSSTGGVSALLALFDATIWLAPWAHATLPVTIGLFAALHRWEPRPAAPVSEGLNAPLAAPPAN